MSKNVRRLLSVTLSVMAILAMGFVSVEAETPSEELFHVARLGLDNFVAAYAGSADDPGAAVVLSLKDGVISRGFRVYTVTPSQLLSKVDQTFDTLVEPTDMWRFIVEVGGKAAGLITVAKVEDKWEAVTVGAAELAQEISEMYAKYPEQEGYVTRFVRVYQAQSDFLEVSGEGQVKGFAPFKSGRMALDVENVLNPGALISEAEIRISLRDVVQENLSRDYQLLNQ